ncbi:kinase-like protein [Polyplosphaeria fusca]|uniref:EKC/KEOPS complex subunit BUD32 n=1 Tax=Polyplosphaeria fusca TaxID=682080 RepID=A0A9P4QW76_9PLEO|nr:kinase-like protein [Polyplosphaeria fusca]
MEEEPFQWEWDEDNKLYFYYESNNEEKVYQNGTRLPVPRVSHTHLYNMEAEPNPWEWDEDERLYFYYDSGNAEKVYQNGTRLPFPRVAQTHNFSVGAVSRIPQTQSSSSTQYSNQSQAFYQSPASTRTDASNSLVPQTDAQRAQSVVSELGPDRYQLGAKLGRGGQAIVYEISENRHRSKDKKSFALRLYFCKDKENYKSRAKKFAKEVKIMEKLRNSNYVARLVDSYEFPRLNTYAFILDPVADGGNLQGMLKQQFEDPSNEVFESPFTHQVLKDLAKGLRDIHGCSIRHKDVSPNNVLIHQWRAKYADFGSSLDFSQGGERTNSSDPLNYANLFYAAPELFSGYPRERSSDIFSLGCTYFEVLCARAAAITRERGWESESAFCTTNRGYFKDMVKGSPNDISRIERKLQQILANSNLEELHGYISLIRRMLKEQIPGNNEQRPSAPGIVTEICG